MSTYSNLKIEEITLGDSGWGTTTTANLLAIQQALQGVTLATGDFTTNVATLTLTNTNALQNARALCLTISATLTGAGTVNVPAITGGKMYLVINNSVGGYAVTVKVTGLTGVSVPNGKAMWLWNNGTDIVDGVNYISALALGTALSPASGGTGVANNVANTVTFTGAYSLAWTLTGATSLTLPTSGTLVTSASTVTLTNKRIDPRVSSTTSTGSITPDISAYDQYCLTAQAATLTINAPTGTPVDGNKLIFRILDTGVSQTLTWNGTYTAIGVTLPTSTTAGKMTYVGCIYNAANTRWDVIAVTTQA